MSRPSWEQKLVKTSILGAQSRVKQAQSLAQDAEHAAALKAHLKAAEIQLEACRKLAA